MRYKQGGTKKWCPHCRTKSINAVIIGARIVRIASGKATDPHLCERVLFCRTCQKAWHSVEVPLTFLEELIQQRDRPIELERAAKLAVAGNQRFAEAGLELGDFMSKEVRPLLLWDAEP